MDFTLHTQFPGNDFAPAWNTLLNESASNYPFLRHEYLTTWWQTRGGGEWPQDTPLALISAHQEGRLAGLAPLFYATNREGKPAYLLLGSIEISDYLDVIARPGDLHPFIDKLFSYLDVHAPHAWDVLDWYNLAETSPSLPILHAEAQKRGWTYEQEIYQPTPSIPLPGDFEHYLAGIEKKQRHEIRRKMRRAEESGRNVRWYIVEHESTLDTEMDAFLHLMSQDPVKDAFLTEVMRSQMKQSIHAAFRAGWLQLAFLEVDGEKACGYLNFDYNNRIWVYNSGLDRRFLDLSAGWVLLGYLLQWANQHKRSEFDFMRGGEDYKYKFGSLDRHVLRVKITRH